MAKRSTSPRPAAQNALPYIQLATFCDNVLAEKDEVVTLVRVVDTFTIDPIPSVTPAEEAPRPGLMLTAVIGLKSGPAKGERTIGFRWVFPSGRKGKAHELPVTFLGEEQGVSIRLQMGLPLEGEGLYWCDVFVGKSLLTRMPARIVYRKTAPAPAGGEGRSVKNE